jgi:hypothetical protein
MRQLAEEIFDEESVHRQSVGEDGRGLILSLSAQYKSVKNIDKVETKEAILSELSLFMDKKEAERTLNNHPVNEVDSESSSQSLFISSLLGSGRTIQRKLPLFIIFGSKTKTFSFPKHSENG